MFSHGKRTAKPCTNNAAPCNAEDLFRESSGKRTMRRHSDRTVQPICFSSVRFYRLLLISNPSTVHAGEGPTQIQNLKPRVENYAEGRLPGLKTPMRSQEQHPCLHFKVPPTNKFPRNKKWMVHPLAVVTTIHLPKQCSQASVSQEYNGPVSTHISLYNRAQCKGKTSSLEIKPPWVQILETVLVALTKYIA